MRRAIKKEINLNKLKTGCSPCMKEAQNHIVNNTFEYPMIKGVSPHPLVVNMGLDFKQDLKTKVVNYGKRQADALEVMTSAGWK